MKNLFSTKALVATALGAALFFVLFAYVKFPTPIPGTTIQVAYGISAFFGAVFGPVTGLLVPLIGHALTDTVLYGSPWWSWVIASGVTGLIASFSYFFIKFDTAKTTRNLIFFNVFQVIGHALSWLFIAPSLDIAIYKEPVELVTTQGFLAFVINALSTAVVGSLLLLAYSKRQMASGSLRIEE